MIRLPGGASAGPLYAMWLGHEEALRAHLEALAAELGRLADRLAGSGAPATSGDAEITSRSDSRKSRLTQAAGVRGTRVRVDALHRLAVVAEDQGWLDTVAGHRRGHRAQEAGVSSGVLSSPPRIYPALATPVHPSPSRY